MANRQEVLVVKDMIRYGYRDKHIQMVTHLKQAYISKVRNGKLQKNTVLENDESIKMTDAQRVRLNALNKILSMPEFYTREEGQDVIYIHVLRFFMIEKEDIFNLYFHMSKKQFNRIWVKRDVDIRKFRSENIGIPYEVYLDLIIDFFIDF